MSDTVKVIIEIPKGVYEMCKDLWFYDAKTLEGAVAKGTPLEEVKAEIEKKYREAEFMNEFSGGYNHAINEVLEVLKSIGKGDKE